MQDPQCHPGKVTLAGLMMELMPTDRKRMTWQNNHHVIRFRLIKPALTMFFNVDHIA